MTDSTNPNRSNAPIFWLLFGAGGMLAAVFGPALIVITGLLGPLAIGFPESSAKYGHALAFAKTFTGKLVLLAIISLFFWHGAERLFLTLKDMKAGSIDSLKLGTYGVAAGVTAATFIMLLWIGF
jgi:fumarate reductase subunit D